MADETTTPPSYEGNLSDIFKEYSKLLARTYTGESASDKVKAMDELRAYQARLGLTEDQVATLDRYAVQALTESGVFDEAGQLQYEIDSKKYDNAINGMKVDFAVDALKGIGSVAQIAKGLSDMSNLSKPTLPNVPQDDPAFTERLRDAQQEAEMVDPAIKEARKKAALMALNQYRQDAATGSAGQAGAYASNMQAAVNRVADSMRAGVNDDERLRLQKQRTYDSLLGQKLNQDRWRYGANLGQYDRNYRDYATQRSDANTLTRTGFENLYGTLDSFSDNMALANYYKGMRSSLREPTTTTPQPIPEVSISDPQIGLQDSMAFADQMIPNPNPGVGAPYNTPQPGRGVENDYEYLNRLVFR